MGDSPITDVKFGQAVPDHFDSACFEIPLGTSSRPEPSIISSSADRASYLLKTESSLAGTDIAVFGDHNLAYYYWHLARKKGRSKEGAFLLHFDAHPDIKSSGPRPFPPDNSYPIDTFRARAAWLTISNFIGDATFGGLVDELYWVIPEWAPYGSIIGDHYWYYNSRASSVYSPDETIFFGHCVKGNKFEALPIRDMMDCEKIDRPFLFKKSYLDSLPMMSGKDVILDIDLDWFCNSGWDSGELLRSAKPDCDKNAVSDVNEMMDVLGTRGIKASSVTIATSPDYMFTDNADDVLYAVVKGLMDHGIVDDPSLIIGEQSYSMNSQHLAASLFNFVSDNMINDPRLSGKDADIDVFNSETMTCRIRTLDELKGHRHDKVDNTNDDTVHPGEKNAQDIFFSCRRGDYSQYASIAEEYGFVVLKNMLEYLERLQSDENSDRSALKNAYETVLYLTRPMTGHLRDAHLEPDVNY